MAQPFSIAVRLATGSCLGLSRKRPLSIRRGPPRRLRECIIQPRRATKVMGGAEPTRSAASKGSSDDLFDILR